jgi:lipopolysaccharide transport system permease protein
MSSPATSYSLPPTASSPEPEWTKTIEAKHSLLHIDWKEIWRYRDLVYLLVKRDFTAQYKQTILGPLWFFIQPLISTIVFTIIFGGIAKLSTDGAPPFLFYMAGVVAWGYFGNCLTSSAATFNENAALFGKVYFPRLVVPIANAATNIFTFAIQLSLFLCVLLFFVLRGADVHPEPLYLMLLPVVLLQMALLGIGVGCIVSSLTTRYKDLSLLVGFGVQLWMYASCVFYPLSAVPEKWQHVLLWNPMVPIIETFRRAFLGAGGVDPVQWAIGFGVCVGIFLVGVMVFRKVERTFTDTV